MRGISTVVDVTVFLLLVSAAVATVTLPVARQPAVPVSPTAEVLGVATADLQYVAGSPATPSLTQPGTEAFERRANGTVAALLAAAAVSNVTVDGRTLLPGGAEFRAAVANATRRVTGWVADPIRVDARWQPYPGAPLAGHVGVGPVPPPTADVRLATLTIPAPMDPVTDRGRQATRRGFDAVATAVARATVDALLPPRRTRVALQSAGRTRLFVRERYRAVAAGLRTGVSRFLEEAETTAANRVLARALAERLAADMRERFDTPAAAARAVEMGTVRLTVRGWPR
jgi:hypothetical protein